jgi:hypothetical protein
MMVGVVVPGWEYFNLFLIRGEYIHPITVIVYICCCSTSLVEVKRKRKWHHSKRGNRIKP